MVHSLSLRSKGENMFILFIIWVNWPYKFFNLQLIRTSGGAEQWDWSNTAVSMWQHEPPLPHSSRAPAVEHIGHQSSMVWPPYAGVWGPVSQRSSSTRRAVGGHMGGGGGGEEGGHGWGGGLGRSTSIVPGGQELRRIQQESEGPFLKSDQLELLFLTPCSHTHTHTHTLPPWQIDTLALAEMWFSCISLMKLHWASIASPLLTHLSH